MKRKKEILKYIYANRYHLAIKFSITELSSEFGISVSQLANDLKKFYDFDYTIFRREGLRWYVYLFRPLKKSSDIKRELNICSDTLTHIYEDIGYKFGRGGDRRSKEFFKKIHS